MRNTALLPYPQHINIRPNTYSGGLPFDRTLMYQAIRGKLNDYGREGTGAQAAADKDDELFRLLGIKPENNGKPAPQVQTSEDDEMDKYFGYKKSVTVANGGGSARMVNPSANPFREDDQYIQFAQNRGKDIENAARIQGNNSYSTDTVQDFLAEQPWFNELGKDQQQRLIANIVMSTPQEAVKHIGKVFPDIYDMPRDEQIDMLSGLQNNSLHNAQLDEWKSNADLINKYVGDWPEVAGGMIGAGLLGTAGTFIEPVVGTFAGGAAGAALGSQAGRDFKNGLLYQFANVPNTTTYWEYARNFTDSLGLDALFYALAGPMAVPLMAAAPYLKKSGQYALQKAANKLGGLRGSLKNPATENAIEHQILDIVGEQGIKEIENSPILRSTFAALSKNPELIENKDVRTVLGKFVYNTSGQKGVAQLDSYIAKLHTDMPRKDIPDYFGRNDINSYFTPDNKRWENTFQSKPGQHKAALDYPYGTSERTRPYVTNSNTPAAPIEAYDFPYAGGSRPINKADDVMETLPSMLPDDPRVKWVAFAGKQLPLLKNDMKIINFFEDLYPDGHLTDYLKQNNMNIQGFIKKRLKEVNVADYSKKKAIESLSGVARNTDLSEVGVTLTGISKSRGSRPNTEQLASIPLINDIVELGRVFRVDPNLSVDGGKIYHLITPLSIGDSNYFAVSVVKGHPRGNGKEAYHYYTHKLKRVKNTGRGYDMADWLDNVEDTSWLPSDMSKLYK